MHTYLATLLFLASLNPSIDLILNGKETIPLEETEAIDFPKTIEIPYDKRADVSIILVTGGRQLYKKETITNKEITLPQFKKAENLVIKIKLPKRTVIYSLKLNYEARK